MNQNSLYKITIYHSHDSWCFDDKARRLSCEPFVLGSSEMIDAVIQANGLELDRGQRYNITFSTRPFPGWSGSVSRQLKEYDGYWYELDGTKLHGWLCPATTLYFDGHPEKIYLAVDSTYEKEKERDDKLMYDTYSK